MLETAPRANSHCVRLRRNLRQHIIVRQPVRRRQRRDHAVTPAAQSAARPGWLWAQWNGQYRDDVRAFVRGDAGKLGALMRRL